MVPSCSAELHQYSTGNVCARNGVAQAFWFLKQVTFCGIIPIEAVLER